VKAAGRPAEKPAVETAPNREKLSENGQRHLLSSPESQLFRRVAIGAVSPVLREKGY